MRNNFKPKATNVVTCSALVSYMAMQAAFAAGSSPQTTDYTTKIVMQPGLSLTFPVHDGLDSRWQHVGDYEFVAEIVESSDQSYAYKWMMTAPADAEGFRATEAADLRSSRRVSLFYPKNQSCTLVGCANAIRVSDATYNDLKRGGPAEFELDGPDSLLVHNQETMPVPHMIQLDGEEMVDVKVNGLTLPVRAIRARTDNNWHYWILDNPRFPIMLKGDGPFRWDPPAFAYAGGLPFQIGDEQNQGGAGGSGNPIAEARDVIKQLEKKGVATTYAIRFAFDSAALTPKSKLVLNELGSYLKKHKDLRLIVEGHTDIIGTMQYNITLSNKRAGAVKKYLETACSIAPSRLVAKGYGYTRPVATNTTSAGRALNRRSVFRKF